MSNIRIARLTLDGYSNYGNLLQNYALQQVLLKYADTVEYVRHKNDNFLPLKWKDSGWSIPIRYILNWRDFRYNLHSGKTMFETVRQGKMYDWCQRYIYTRRDKYNIRELGDEYDFFVVGSDQVWNPLFAASPETFLMFAPSEKRIAYAASISYPEIPTDKMPLFKLAITDMAHISMREQQGAELVREISGRDVPVLVDPTFLLTPDDWRKVSHQPAWYHGGDYILTYFLGKRPEVIARLEQETGLKVVNLLDTDMYEYYVTGPDEFLWAIEHAKLVYTDSFHGTVFSILFRTPFVVCNRIGSAAGEKMGSRINTLLGYFGLEARRGTKENGYAIENPLSEPDWSQVDDVLARERKRSDEYLRQALKVDEVQGL